MANYNTKLQNNNELLENVISQLNSMPESAKDTSDATVSTDEIITGRTAYNSEGKITGSFSIDSELTVQESNLSAIKNYINTLSVAYDYTTEDKLITRNLTKYINNYIKYIRPYAFAPTLNLTTVVFPNAVHIGSFAFQQCSSLTTVSFPNVTTIGNSAFYSCPSLTTVSFPNVTTIGSYAFYHCSKLTSIYLMNSIVCSLLNSSAFDGTGITSSKGSIFVPASLVTSYKAATNWVYFSNRIFAI